MDKKLILYLLVLAGLITATFLSVRANSDSDDGKLTINDMQLLEDTGHFEIVSSVDSNEDKLEPLNGDGRGLSRDDLGNGEEPDPEVVTAYEKFLGEKDGGSPLITFGLFIITGIFVGFLVVTYVLPNIVQRASEEVYGSTEKVGAPDAISQAQASVAQGEWEEAIAHYREAAAEDPSNRLPWVEIALLQRERLEDPQASLATLDEALARGGWRENDEAFFIFRKIEIYEHDLNQHEKAVAQLREVIEKFPQTRHSANAMHKLHELGESA
ncbi:tetratricopeptide repeat protein [Roseibacillus ishigakijimensis]|uniref:Tetratricopeptide repeat protein n=1 Tax=Roseibacillus ishigakijimensis TaxID=454146 RepID=A0A934VNQ6_9BACT|nr:tetratricopeptide repeat protein [Roseibacillus ishigakijimensis]MBK1835321.1 tetratricopeptide repeat protein [Roseibacillus ishigakijimensis]